MIIPEAGKSGTQSIGTQERAERWHPLRMLVYLCLFSIAVLFAVLLIAFAGARAYEVHTVHIPLPRSFVLSTLLIAASSYSVSSVVKAYKRERFQSLTYRLGLTMILGVLFMVAQVMGWNELQEEGVFLSGRASGSYLYFIPGLHLLHLAGGLLFLGWMFHRSYEACFDSVKELIFSTDPFQQVKLELLVLGWHFLGLLWVLLFAVMALLL